jgi:hypothetical protein
MCNREFDGGRVDRARAMLPETIGDDTKDLFAYFHLFGMIVAHALNHQRCGNVFGWSLDVTSANLTVRWPVGRVSSC